MSPIETFLQRSDAYWHQIRSPVGSISELIATMAFGLACQQIELKKAITLSTDEELAEEGFSNEFTLWQYSSSYDKEFVFKIIYGWFVADLSVGYFSHLVHKDYYDSFCDLVWNALMLIK